MKAKIEEAISTMANSALRTIIFAKKELKQPDFSSVDDRGVFKVE